MPNSPDVQGLEVILGTRAGDQARVVTALREVFRLQDNNFNLLRYSNALWDTGERDEAVAALERWLVRYPEDRLALLELGNRLIFLERGTEAVDRFKQVLAIAPEDILALNNLAWLLKDEQPAPALAYAEQALALAPTVSFILDTAAMTYLSNDQLPKARELITRALELESSPAYLYHQALILKAGGANQNAIEALQRALADERAFDERAAAEVLLTSLQRR